MVDYIEVNRDLWNGWTKIHEKSRFYDMDAFKHGASTLKEVELEELGDVTGKSMLHSQCHFGQDSLSWARKGAEVTGVDISDESIKLAKSLSKELNIPAQFLRSNIYDLPKILDEKYDIFFTSYGALDWLPDTKRLAEVAASVLKPGGIFYIVEFHSFVGVLDDDGIALEYPYFHDRDKPFKLEENGSYADNSADFKHDSYVWNHGLGELITALIESGLQIEFVHEFPFSTWNCWPFLQEREPGRFYHVSDPNLIPLMFSIRARRV